MIERISAVIIDPLKNEHDYSIIKTQKRYDYDEENFDLLVLENADDVLSRLSEFKGYDCLITIGNDINCIELNNASFEVRKRWIHLPEFNKDRIVDAILLTFLGNIGRKRNEGEKLFSIFTCTFNTGEKEFFRLYNSLKLQTYRNWNWWILDDSKNNSVVKMVDKINDERVILIRNHTNHGVIGFNKHVIASACDGDYLVEVDHDDELLPYTLEYINAAFERFPDTDFVYSDDLEIMNDTIVNYADEYGKWGHGEGYTRQEKIGDIEYTVCATPNVTPYSIRSIHLQPNHVRCWKKDFYHRIGGHETCLSVLDDMEILVRTFLNGKMTKIEKVLYVQHEGEGERGKSSGTAQSVRFGEIQRTDEYLKWKYDTAIHNRILELGYEDVAWKENEGCSFLWEVHEPSNIMNNIFYDEQD
jgi:hypothetical protein